MSVPPLMSVISRNCPAYTNDDFSGAFPASHANNSTYGDFWRCATTPTGNANSGTLTQAVYLAYDLSAFTLGQCVVVWYNDPSTGNYDYTLFASNPENLPDSYTIDANAAAGGSLPGSGWVTLATVTGNHYHSRQHAVNLTGYNWVRINVTAINGSVANNNVQLNMDVHDVSKGNLDNWIFYGDSITVQGFLHSDPTLPAQINASITNFPLMEDGGIAAYLSTDGASHISTWLPLFSGQYVGLLYGTNDANNASVGDPSFGPAFTTAMTSMMTAVTGAGKIPVLPKTICWGKTTNIQGNGPEINTRLAALAVAFPTTVVGPDLWAYFEANQSLIVDNDVHPTLPAGYAAYQVQWMNALIASVYTSGSPFQGRSPYGLHKGIGRVLP